MDHYRELLGMFMKAVITGDVGQAAKLVENSSRWSSEAQVTLYAANYRSKLSKLLRECYPALLYLLAETFDARAAEFIAGHPPRHFNLDTYPVDFARWVETHAGDTFASDLAAFEAAMHDVYLAPESEPLSFAWIEKQTPESLAASPLPLREACRLLAAAFAVNVYYDLFRNREITGATPTRLLPKPTYLLVHRRHKRIEVMELAAAEYTLLTLLAEGMTLADALEDERFSAFADASTINADVMRWFARWVQHDILRQP